MKCSKMVAAIAILGIICLFLGGCMEKEPPDASIKTYCEAILHRDSTSLKKFNRTRDEVDRAFLRVFVTNHQREAGQLFSEDQSRRIGMAFLDNFSKLAVLTSVKAKEGRNAVVQVTVHKLDLSSADRAVEAEVYQRATMWSTQEEIAEIMTQAMIRQLNTVKLSGMSTFTVNCTYNSDTDRWEPNDIENFSVELMMAALGA